MMRYGKMAVTFGVIGVGVVLLSAAQGAALAGNAHATELVVKGVGLAILGIVLEFFRRLYTKLMAALDMLPNIASALWGTPSPEGQRSGGLVSDVAEIKQALEDMRGAD